MRGYALALAYYRAGQVLRATKEYPEAERYLRDALTAYQGFYGNTHFWVAASRRELGITLGEAGKNAEAETELREAVRQLEVVHGDRRTTVGALMELGQFLVRVKRNDEALEVYRKAAGYAAKNRRDRPRCGSPRWRRTISRSRRTAARRSAARVPTRCSPGSRSRWIRSSARR